ncbi:hypothetical protein [Moheibacter sediminis]|uniref:Uncharacterized protein n=1 Tax=Moheibacter sediminis TaxID=1434700 RepID=A0A1W2CLV2_9FLAO|nr:hypothetical protein [Moheibacter sediminis]SMC85862.1 hypothetical protein SAMN06296427_1119 [Moheibacter sediminis]
MKSYKSLLCFIIIIFFFQGCTRYVTTVRDIGITNYYFSSGFSDNLIETKNDSIAEITYFNEQQMMLSAPQGYSAICEFCNDFFEAEIVFKNLNKREYSYPLICLDFEDFNRKTVQIESGEYEVFMNINCAGERNKQNRTLDMGNFEIKKGEKRNLNIWIDLDIVTHDAIEYIKIPRKEYRKIQK